MKKCISAGFIDIANTAAANTNFPESFREKMKDHVQFLTQTFGDDLPILDEEFQGKWYYGKTKNELIALKAEYIDKYNDFSNENAMRVYCCKRALQVEDEVLKRGETDSGVRIGIISLCRGLAFVLKNKEPDEAIPYAKRAISLANVAIVQPGLNEQWKRNGDPY